MSSVFVTYLIISRCDHRASVEAIRRAPAVVVDLYGTALCDHHSQDAAALLSRNRGIHTI